MEKGIALFGGNGAGKSTLAHALAKELGYFEMDVEDYYFPEQKASRINALEGAAGPAETACLGEIPFSSPREKAEVEAAILADVTQHPRFLLSGVTLNWRDEILDRIGLAILLETPLEERLRRIQAREERRFGARVLPGGDLAAGQAEFRKMVAARDPQAIEESGARLRCPVHKADGTLPLAELVERAQRWLKQAGMLPG